jgi:casein kinase II subunit alpha
MVHTQHVLKLAPELRLQRERKTFQEFEGDACIRQLVDYGKEPPFLVLEHLDSDTLNSSSEARITRQDTKLIARNNLSALVSLHARGVAHTGIMVRLGPAMKQGWTDFR